MLNYKKKSYICEVDVEKKLYFNLFILKRMMAFDPLFYEFHYLNPKTK